MTEDYSLSAETLMVNWDALMQLIIVVQYKLEIPIVGHRLHAVIINHMQLKRTGHYGFGDGITKAN
jgi:hypothetical protein